MSSDAGLVADAGPADAGVKRKRAGVRLLTALLVLGGLAGLGVYLWPHGSAQKGEPVLVLDLPGLNTPGSERPGGGDGIGIRKSIDSENPPVRNPPVNNPLVNNPPVNNPLVRNPLVRNPPARPGSDLSGPVKTGIPRAPEPPPGMKKVRIIDPSKSAGGPAQRVRRALVRAPLKALQEKTPFGAIPRIAKDGRKPFDVYARPAGRKTAVGAPQPARIAIMIGGLGISQSGTREAINKLPEEITLAFAPYGQGLQNLVDSARRNGHEVMLQIPMEPFDYPDNDPGPRTLLSTIEPSENVKRLKWLMSRFSGYFGVTNYMGARFTSTEKSLQPIMKWLGARGLVYLDDGASPRSQTLKLSPASGLKVKIAAARLDYGQTPKSIKAGLEKLERLAAEQGLAIGVGSGMPLTIKFVAAWAKTLADRGIVLVPVSAAFRKQHH